MRHKEAMKKMLDKSQMKRTVSQKPTGPTVVQIKALEANQISCTIANKMDKPRKIGKPCGNGITMQE